jgi:hypothetical protein
MEERKMKRWILILAVIFFSVILLSCGDDDDDAKVDAASESKAPPGGEAVTYCEDNYPEIDPNDCQDCYHLAFQSAACQVPIGATFDLIFEFCIEDPLSVSINCIVKNCFDLFDSFNDDRCERAYDSARYELCIKACNN